MCLSSCDRVTESCAGFPTLGWWRWGAEGLIWLSYRVLCWAFHPEVMVPRGRRTLHSGVSDTPNLTTYIYRQIPFSNPPYCSFWELDTHSLWHEQQGPETKPLCSLSPVCSQGFKLAAFKPFSLHFFMFSKTLFNLIFLNCFLVLLTMYIKC